MKQKPITEVEFRPQALFKIVLRTGIYIIISVFLFLVLLSTLQCTIKKPIAPSWNTKLTIPLMSKHYDMAYLVEEIDDPNLQLDSLGNPYLSFEEKLDTVEVKENLNISPVSKSLSDTLGTINLNPSETSQNTVALADIYPWGTGTVPDTNFTFQLQVEQVGFFTQATVESGSATMIVENQLGVDFDSVVVDVIDSVSTSVIATFVFPNGVLDTETDSQTANLSSQTISNELYYDTYAHTPGDTIFTTSDKYFNLTLSIDDIIVSQATAQIPSIFLQKNDTLAFSPSEVEIDSATIKSGNISLNLDNFSNLDANVEVRLPDFTLSGQTLTVNRFITGGGATNVDVPLDGYDFVPQVSQALRVEVDALTENSEERKVYFSSSDSIKLYTSTNEIQFSRISGTIPQTQVSIDTMQRELDLSEGFENMQLTNAQLELEISNGVDLPVNFSILIQGDNGKELNLNGYVEKGSATSPTQATIIDSNLSQFLDPIPQNIIITETALCGEAPNQKATITDNDFVFAQIKIISPLEFVMGSSDVQIESTSHELNEDTEKLITENLNWGKVVVNATNHLPIGASIELYISSDQQNLFTNPDLTIGPISVANGVIGPDGLVEEVTLSNEVVELTSQDMEVFKNKPFYIGGNLHLPGTGGEQVRAVGSDYLDVSAYLELEINTEDKN